MQLDGQININFCHSKVNTHAGPSTVLLDPRMKETETETETHNSIGRVGSDGELLIAVIVLEQKIYG